MASVYVIEIDGWGEVGPAINVTNAEGFSDGSFTLTTGGSPPASDELGAMIWVQGCDSVIADGYYTLTAVVGSTFTMQADPAEVTVTSYAPASGLARIEDHYKISDSMPSWVTGANAQARWFRDLIGVSESAGQRIKTTGGIASVDGFEFTMARRSGMAAILADTYLLASRGPVVLFEALAADSTTIVTESAVPYAGESVSSPSGAAQPVWIGTEAIDVRGTITGTDPVGGVTAYTMTHNGSTTFVTRGVLRTLAQSHAQSVAVFGAMPTPIGQIARAYVYDYGHASHADRSVVSEGACESIDPSQAHSTAQTFALASHLLSGNKRTDSTTATAFGVVGEHWSTGSQRQRVESINGSRWNYMLVDGVAAVLTARTGSDPVSVNSDGIEEWDYLTITLVDELQDFPVVRRPDSRESWEKVSIPRGEELIDPRLGIWLPTQPLTMRGIGSVYVAATAASYPLCHVFRPDTWAKSENFDTYIGLGERYVRINPVDAILEILTSTGTGNNGTHDDAPKEFGFGVDVNDLETATFTTIGNRLETEGIEAGSIALLSTEDNDLRERLDILCQTFGLAIVTTTTGKVRLVDMVEIDYDTAVTLDQGDLVEAPASLTLSTGGALNSVTLNYDRPWVDPETAEARQKQTMRADTGGILESLYRVSGQSITLAPWFAASVDDDSRDALAKRWSRLIGQTNGVVGTITAEVDSGYSGQIGDTVAVTLPAFPNAQDSGPMSGALCRIVDRVHVSRPVGRASDALTLHAYGVTADDKPRQWAPSGVVSSVTSKLVFNLEPTTYSGGINYDSDAVSFADGVDVDIYTTNWSLRSTVTPGTVASTAGNTVTLSVAAAGGSGDVTPSVGDKITLAGEQNQSVSEAAKWGWLSTSTPGYLWR
jgi:hypothetical protein